MGGLAKVISSAANFIWFSLRPVVLIILVFIIIAFSLFAYDQYRTYQEKQLGATLIHNIRIKSTCNETVNAGSKFNLKFSVTNQNNQEVGLKKIDVDVNLLGTEGKEFTNLLSTKPTSLKIDGEQGQFEEYQFQPSLELLKDKKTDILFSMQAVSRNQAKASSHTIVAYKGKVVFYFTHEMSIEASCQIQVRYP